MSTFHPILLLTGYLFGFILVGCESTTMKGSDAGTPKVLVEGAIIDEIVEAIETVMPAKGYRLTEQRFPLFVYDKEGSAMDDFAYGSMLEPNVWERVTLRIRDLGPDAHEIECEPFLVSDRGSIFEEVKRISRFRRGKYNDLIREIRANVRTP